MWGGSNLFQQKKCLRSCQVEPHHFVADLCAAPASKTLQLLDLMAGSPGLAASGSGDWLRRTQKSHDRSDRIPRDLHDLWNVMKVYDVFNCFYVWPTIYLKNSEDVSRHASSLSCMPLPFRSAELPHSGDVSPGLLVVNDDSWSRCATALRRSHQHANPSPLMWLCGDAREAACLALIDDNC